MKTIDNVNEVLKDDLKTELKNYLEKNQSLASSEVYDQVISVDTTNGLQVRCVSIGSAVK